MRRRSKTIRIDNLTPAVKKQKSKFEEAQLTDEFLRFTIHYGCDVQVCNPRSGMKKDMSKIKWVMSDTISSRLRQSWTPFESLNKQLEEQLKADRKGRIIQNIN